MFYLIIYLILLLVIILFSIISSYFHELGHYLKFKKYGIKSKIRFKHCNTINKDEEDKFLHLSKPKKKEILLAGIKNDLIVLYLIIFINFILIFIKFGYSTPIHFLISILLLIQILRFTFNLLNKNSDISKLQDYC